MLFVLALAGCVTRSSPPETRSVMPTRSDAVDINVATAAKLRELPGIGAVLAERIVAHREKYGSFRRAEHLLMVRGISEQKFRNIQSLIKADGQSP
jgi:competence protein ComEA